MAFATSPKLEEFGETYQDDTDPSKFKSVFYTRKRNVLDLNDGLYKAYLQREFTTGQGQELEIEAARVGKVRGNRGISQFSVLDGRMFMRVQVQRNTGTWQLLSHTLSDFTPHSENDGIRGRWRWVYETQGTGLDDLRIDLEVNPGRAKWSYEFRAPIAGQYRQRIQINVPGALSSQLFFRKNILGDLINNGSAYMVIWQTPDGPLEYNFIDAINQIGSVTLNSATHVLSLLTGPIVLAQNEVFRLDPTFGPSDATYTVDTDGASKFPSDGSDWCGRDSSVTYRVAWTFNIGSISSANTIDQIDVQANVEAAASGSQTHEIGAYNSDGTGDPSTDDASTTFAACAGASYVTGITAYQSTGSQTITDIGNGGANNAHSDVESILDAAGSNYSLYVKGVNETVANDKCEFSEYDEADPPSITIEHTAGGVANDYYYRMNQ